MKLNRDFRELLESFAAHDVRYLIVGGWAVAAHGHPRYTKDLDIWIWMDETNSEATLAALVDFGFGALGLTASDFTTPNTVVQLGYPPNRVDLLTSPSGVTFEECWQERVELRLDELVVPFIGIVGLIANKSATGRTQDLADIENLRDEGSSTV